MLPVPDSQYVKWIRSRRNKQYALIFAKSDIITGRGTHNGLFVTSISTLDNNQTVGEAGIQLASGVRHAMSQLKRKHMPTDVMHLAHI